MIRQAFKPGQKVQPINKIKTNGAATYTVITTEPIFQKTPISEKLRNIFRPIEQPKEIISYKYRCKSGMDMKDFLQEELLSA